MGVTELNYVTKKKKIQPKWKDTEQVPKRQEDYCAKMAQDSSSSIADGECKSDILCKRPWKSLCYLV